MWERIDASQTSYRTQVASRGATGGEPAKAWAVAVGGAGGAAGWSLQCHAPAPNELEPPPSEDRIPSSARFELQADAAKPLPELNESYVRGSDLVLLYAQRKPDPFGIAVQVTPIEASDRTMIVQLTLSMQTDLLDSHPAVVLTAAAGAKSENGAKTPAIVGPRLVAAGEKRPMFATVLLSPRDQHVARDQSTEDSFRVRFFGNFLEKGVIRKCRPWLLISRETPPAPREIGAAYHRLCQVPLPLTT